ncbi:MAG TPA: sugar ABC transporter ATP-binding protein [Candidatus Limnocylindrales bacterium]|nr:sugar ABC transporter ATP-binding protein [Candidatus Limnocylindrales bacterium]
MTPPTPTPFDPAGESLAAVAAGAPILAMTGIDKRFPGAHALHAVDVHVARGEILGLVGENGAGKSTLVRILAGAETRDAGEIRVDGTVVDPRGPADMLGLGIAVIYQEPALAPNLTVAENIFMGRLPTSTFGRVDWRRLSEDTAVVADRLGLDLSPTTRVARLSVARRQMVEIAKALSRDARLIVLDEPSAVLGDAELAGLFGVMRRLAERGVAFIYISHRLDEVFRITDRVTVLKDGRVVADRPTPGLDDDELVRLMVGRTVERLAVGPGAGATTPALRIRGLRRAGVLHGIDLDVGAGEIVGIAGLAGAGRTELLRAIHGADPIDDGTLEVFGRDARIRSPRDAIALGIGLLTEDRKGDGLLLRQSLASNVTVSRLGRISRAGVLSGRRERHLVQGHIERLAIRARGPRHPVRVLSGGNQQKVVFARWLSADCRILLVDEPTRGVDVGAKREIHQLLLDLARRGTAIVMVSSELPEVLALSDRVVVMREGRATAVLDRSDATEERIMAHATRPVA